MGFTGRISPKQTESVGRTRSITERNLCIPHSSSDYYNYYNPGSYYSSTGSVTAYVIDVNKNKNFTLQAVNLPEKENFEVSVGKCNYSTPTVVGEIKTGNDSGTFTDTYRIPNKFDGVSCLIAYLDSTKSARSATVTFTNDSSGGTSGSSYDESNLSFVVKAVKKNKSVTLRVTDFRKGEKYHIFVGKAGSGAYPYTYVGSFRQTDNKDFGITVNIPEAYKGQAKLDVRIEGITVAASQVHTFKNVTY